ncbi:MAG: hypothetical protein K2J37_02695 [Ruminococcus sp.]|nr:hypothetical protein [Ruminococcus sp.]MDE6785164.1 hypothetical protein [Ruminococcus sp.]
MSNIRYNEEQEAFELPYKLWDRMITVRFYTDSEEDIMNNLSDIAVKLETVNGGKKKIAQIAADEGYYEGSAETLAENIVLKDIYVDIDDEEIVVCFTVSSDDGYMCSVNIELYDSEFEITGRN